MTLRLYVPDLTGAGPSFDLPPGAARHVQVRRLQPGDALVLFDGAGGERHAVVQQMGRQQVRVSVGELLAVDRELGRRVVLAVVVPHGDRMDGVIEKASELGAAGIVPLISERSVLRLDGERAQRKREHWQAVAVSACEQCGRTRVPEVASVQALRTWLRTQAGPGECWLLSPGATQGLPREAPRADVTVLSGPEGGFSAEEEAAALAAGFHAKALGPRILRADTAPISVLAWLALSP